MGQGRKPETFQDQTQDQAQVFAEGEGDAWWQRNRRALISRDWADDPVIDSLRRNKVVPSRALEVGCADGGRLAHLAAVYGTRTVGIEPSSSAVESGRQRFPAVELMTGTHRSLSPDLGRFDLVVLGFFLYLTPREDLFRLAADVDAVLEAGGHLALFDFDPGTPGRRPFGHRDGVVTWKMRHADLFEANPQYVLVEERRFAHDDSGDFDNPDDRVTATLLHKVSAEVAYPLTPS